MGKTKKEVKRNRPARKCSMNKCLAQIAVESCNSEIQMAPRTSPCISSKQLEGNSITPLLPPNNMDIECLDLENNDAYDYESNSPQNVIVAPAENSLNVLKLTPTGPPLEDLPKNIDEYGTDFSSPPTLRKITILTPTAPPNEELSPNKHFHTILRYGN